jgi:hypothetical protein
VQLLALAFACVALAGCSGDGPGPSDPTQPPLQAGKGAIAGLLVDDRFRPIHLTVDAASTEFQARGFVLLQETGAQMQTTPNGEFSFADLDPGAYTLRVTASGHEATPQRVEVRSGEFSEVSVVARRVSSAGGLIISYEYAAFVSCGTNLIVVGSSFDCTLDQSGDSSREAFTVDYTGYDATYFVMEMRADNPQYFDVWLQPPGNEFCDGAYQIMGGPDTTYLRWQLKLGEAAVSSPTASGADCQTLVWDNTEPMQTIVYLNSIGFDQGIGFGLGAYIGVQANFVQNVFIGDPGVSVDAFCVLC